MVILTLYNTWGRVSRVWACPTRERACARVVDDAELDEVQALILGPGVRVVMVRPYVDSSWSTHTLEALR